MVNDDFTVSQMHLDGAHAAEVAQRLVDVVHARTAAHAFDLKFCSIHVSSSLV